MSGREWASDVISQLKNMPNVVVKNRSQVFGYYDHNMTVMFERVAIILKTPLNTHLAKDYTI